MNREEAQAAAAWAKGVGLKQVRTRNTPVGYVVTCENPRGGPLHSESLADLQNWVARWAPEMLTAGVTA